MAFTCQPKSRSRRFAKCDICGTHGHYGKRCPVYQLNREQTLLAEEDPEVKQIRVGWFAKRVLERRSTASD